MNNKLHFGTDGIRGKTNKFPFTPDALFCLGQAISQWGKEKYGTQSLKILLGHDTRESCEEIKKALSLDITDGQVLPTPAVLQIIERDRTFHFGIIISASHNPYTDNGIKLFDAKTGKLSPQDEATITEYFESYCNKKNSETWPYAQEVYMQNITTNFPPKLLIGTTVVLDCANGATYKVAPELFSRLGAKVIAIHTNPNGKNINQSCGSLHPEKLIQAVLEHQADIGFAFDGDGDRVMAASKTGELKDGDDLLAILLQNESFQHIDTIVGTIMTNYGFEQMLQTNGKKLIRTKVGDKYVAAALEQHSLPLGGEASGHIIIRSYLNTGDGIFVALKTLESVIAHNNWDLHSFEKTPQHMVNLPVSQKKPLTDEPYATMIREHEQILLNGRIVVRYSGTENVLRVMVEDKTVESVQNIAKSLCNNLRSTL